MINLTVLWFQFVLLGAYAALHCLATPLDARASVSMNEYASDLFTSSMSFQDQYWDESAGYLVTAASDGNGRWDTRQTAWYAVGLLARNGNGGQDVQRAIGIFERVIEGQYVEPGNAWYGTYQQNPEEPLPGSAGTGFLAEEYSQFDPNWSQFISCAWIFALENYSDLVPSSLVDKILGSLKTAALGSLTRVGINGDNLYLSYTNPRVMRAFQVAWVGYRLGDANLTEFAENDAQAIYDLYSYDGWNTVSEYNVPTYYGITLWGLGLWTAYTPNNSTLRRHAPQMISSIINDTSEVYNANLKNMVGPWDRSYGMDMMQYQAIIGQVIWTMVGRDASPIPRQILGSYHVDDYGFGHLVALISPYILEHVSDSAIERFRNFPGEHSLTRNIRSTEFNTTYRTDHFWISDWITIGAQTVNESAGTRDPTQYNPAVILWKNPESPTNSWLTLYASTTSLVGAVSPGQLNVTFPRPLQTNVYTWLTGGFPIGGGRRQNVTGLDDLPGLGMDVRTEGLDEVSATYEIENVIHLFHSWNITFMVQDGFEGLPSFSFTLEGY